MLLYVILPLYFILASRKQFENFNSITIQPYNSKILVIVVILGINQL